MKEKVELKRMVNGLSIHREVTICPGRTLLEDAARPGAFGGGEGDRFIRRRPGLPSRCEHGPRRLLDRSASARHIDISSEGDAGVGDTRRPAEGRLRASRLAGRSRDRVLPRLGCLRECFPPWGASGRFATSSQPEGGARSREDCRPIWCVSTRDHPPPGTTSRRRRRHEHATSGRRPEGCRAVRLLLRPAVGRDAMGSYPPEPPPARQDRLDRHLSGSQDAGCSSCTHPRRRAGASMLRDEGRRSAGLGRRGDPVPG